MPEAESRKKRQSDKLLASIGSLKRATGIADHPAKPDEWVEGDCRIYTSDAASAEVLANLFYKIYYGNHTPGYYVRKGKNYTSLKDFVEVKQIDHGCYETYVPVDPGWIPGFTNAVDDLVRQQIAPGSPAGRGR